MIIIETCPKCGHDLQDVWLCSYPAFTKKECFSCGWSWTGEREEVIRVPFGGNTYFESQTTGTISVEEQDGGSYELTTI